MQSVMKQTFTDWECIVVDDGSTDDTKDVILSLQKKDPRIRYIYQNNAERSAARNNGISNSKGQYICFLDSDDLYQNDYLQHLHFSISRQQETKAMFLSQMIVVENNQRTVHHLPALERNLIDYFLLNPVIPGRVCIHSEILRLLNFDEDIVVIEDGVLWMRIAEKFPVHMLELTGVEYYIHDTNSVNRAGSGAMKTYKGITLAKKRYPALFNKLTGGLYDDWLSRVQTNVAVSFYLNHKRLLAILWLIYALFTKPVHRHTKYRLLNIFRIAIGQKMDL